MGCLGLNVHGRSTALVGARVKGPASHNVTVVQIQKHYTLHLDYYLCSLKLVIGSQNKNKQQLLII